MTTKTIPDLLDQASENQGLFGAVRKHDVHTGTDLYCPENTLVRAIELGTVVWVGPFTGLNAGSPWWNDTEAVMVEGPSGVILYGEVVVDMGVECGTLIEEGEGLGRVRRVLREDKGKPTSMLHLELYEPGATECVWWHLGDQQPESLCDSTRFLREFVTQAKPWWNLDAVMESHTPRPGDLTVCPGIGTYCLWLENERGHQVIRFGDQTYKWDFPYVTTVFGIKIPLDNSGDDGPCLLVAY